MAWELKSITTEKVRDNSIPLNANKNGAWEVKSIETQGVKDNSVNGYIKRAENLLLEGKYTLAINELNSAISISKQSELGTVKKQKMKVLNIFIQNGLMDIKGNRIHSALSNFGFYIDNSQNLVNYNDYTNGLISIVNCICNTENLFKNNSNDVFKLLDLNKRAISLCNKRSELLDKQYKYSLKYIKYIVRTINDVSEGINIINKARVYSTGTTLEIERLCTELYIRLNDYNSVIKYIEINLRTLLNTVDGRFLLTKCCTCINNSKSNSYKQRLIGLLESKSIPGYFLTIGFGSNFNFNYLSSELNSMVVKLDIDKSKKIMKCIKEYFNYYQLDRSRVINYAILTKDFGTGVNHLNYYLNKNPKSIDLLKDKAYLICKLRGNKEAIDFIKSQIYIAENLKDLDLVLELIQMLMKFSNQNNISLDIDKEVHKIKNSDIIVKYLYPVFEIKKSINYDSVINGIIERIDIICDNDILRVIDILKNYYTYTLTRAVEFARMIYDKREYKKALIVLNNFERNLRTGFLDELYRLKLDIYISQKDDKNIIEVCEKLIWILGAKKDEDVLKVYTKTILRSKEYKRGVNTLTDYLSRFRNIDRKKSILINKYLSKLYLREFKIVLAIGCKIKSSFIRRITGYINDNKTIVISIVILAVILLGGVYQYKMFSSGKWKPLGVEGDLFISNIILDIGEAVDIEISKAIFPSYAKSCEESFIIEDENIIKIENGQVIGINEGKTKLTLLLGDKEIEDYYMTVSRPLVEDFTIDYYGDLNEVGDSIDLIIDIKYKDARETEIVKSILSSNSNIVSIVDERLVAVGVGYAEVAIDINGISKKLIFEIEDNNYSYNYNSNYSSNSENDYLVIAGSYEEFDKSNSIKKELIRHGINANLTIFNKSGVDYYRVVVKENLSREKALEEVEVLSAIGIEAFIVSEN